MEAFNPDIKVGKANLTEHTDGLSFIEDNELRDRWVIDGLQPHEGNSERLIGFATLHDEDGPVVDPIAVVIEAGAVEEAKKITMFFHEHGKKLGTGAATVAVIAVGSLFVRRKLRK